METVQIRTRCIDCAHSAGDTFCHRDGGWHSVFLDGFCDMGVDDSKFRQAYREKFPGIFEWGEKYVKDKEWWRQYVELHDPRKPGYKKELAADSDESENAQTICGTE